MTGARGMPDTDPWLPRMWTQDDGLHLDVRGLQPSLTLAQIRRVVDHCERNVPVVIHLDRESALLWPELLLYGWWAERIPGEPGEIRLRLTALRRSKAAPDGST